MSQKLSSLAAGAKVEFLTFKGQKVVWRVIGKNLTGMPAESTTLLTDGIIALMPFDAKEPSNSDSNRKNYGNNDWVVSNIRQWLNSDKGAGAWYTAQHSADQAPDKANVNSGYNAYQSWAGFLNEATSDEKDALLETSRQIGGRSGNATSCTDKVFFLTSNEVGLETIANNGTKIAYFTDNASRIAYPTAQCVSINEWSGQASSTSTAWYWWLATSYPSDSYNVRHVYPDGSLDYNLAFRGRFGARPACNLKSDILVSDSTNAEGNYTIIYNQPPTAPSTISVPEKIVGGKPFEITWSAGTDPEGAVTGYTLQRKTKSQDWGNVYTGSPRSYTDTVPRGTGTVQYRVRTNDAAGLTSGWTTSLERQVSDNQPPVVALNEPAPKTVTDAPPKSEYTVTDEDGDAVTAREYVDGALTKTHQPELGHTYEIEMDKTNWVNVLNGTHTYKVEAEDPDGEKDTKEVSWTKDVDGIAFRLSKPLQADERPSVAVLTFAGAIPAEAHILIQVCNNGNDAEPAWVDATNAAKSGSKVFLPNETKTADQWGFDIKVTVDRQLATDPVYLTSINGNFA